MSDSLKAVRDVASHAADPGPLPGRRISAMASGLIGSEILRIAGEIRSLAAAGHKVCDLTVGDFAPRLFPIPERLASAVTEALARGETNYPPANGVLQLRQAVQRFYARELGLEYPLESVLIAGGARPVIYAIYRTLCDAGDRVVYPVPSWNNNHYVHLVGAAGVPVLCGAETRFMPTREALVENLSGARLLCLNSPLNPAGTALDARTLEGICDAVLAENDRRETSGERPLYVLYDQVYWMLCFGATRHVTPPGLRPEMARFTLFVDGISKSFAATGLRVGWAVGPTDVVARMSSVLGHVGAWAPRAEQVATVALLDDQEAIRSFSSSYLQRVQVRLDALHAGFQAMKDRGRPVESIAPMGAIYLTLRVDAFGRRTPAGDVLRSNEDIRRYLLEQARVALVPFQAFGAPEDDGWFRASVGAVAESEIEQALPRIEAALGALA